MLYMPPRMQYGYEECITWNENEAAIRHQLEEEVRAKDAK